MFAKLIMISARKNSERYASPGFLITILSFFLLFCSIYVNLLIVNDQVVKPHTSQTSELPQLLYPAERIERTFNFDWLKKYECRLKDLEDPEHGNSESSQRVRRSGPKVSQSDYPETKSPQGPV